MRLLDRLLGGPTPPARHDTVDQFTFNQLQYALGMQGTLTGPVETAPAVFTEYTSYGYAGNGVVFACMLARMLAFATPRFTYQAVEDGRPGEFFHTGALDLLNNPWPGGSQQDLLMSMILDADLAGNSYTTLSGDGKQLVRLRPDWVDILLQPITRNDRHIGWKKVGYLYTPQDGGAGEPAVLAVNEVCHFAPIPDPLARYRGMSWLTPVVREITADVASQKHKQRYFEAGATPSMIVTFPTEVKPEKLKGIRKILREENAGIDNAFEPLVLAGGADVTVAGSDLKQVEFSVTQGAGETRIAAAAGTPPVIVGLSEGLKAATYSNYGQARRRFADGTCHPLWGSAAGSLSTLFPAPRANARMFYDARDVPLLREDTKDAAGIQQTRASTINSLVLSGFTADSAIAAVTAEDLTLLVHSGAIPVQLHPDGKVSQMPGADTTSTDDEEPEADPAGPPLPVPEDEE